MGEYVDLYTFIYLFIYVWIKVFTVICTCNCLQLAFLIKSFFSWNFMILSIVTIIIFLFTPAVIKN